MNVKLNSIWGIDDAIISMYISKRTWNPELDTKIRNLYSECVNKSGFPINNEKQNELFELLNKVARMSIKHITVGRFIQLSYMVTGLHRGGQDDWDSHARRFDNRIIRSSTRLASFSDEKSNYYTDKIKTTDEILSHLNINTPDEVEIDGITYTKTINGYIKKEFKGVKDVERGLYMLSIPSNFIFQTSLCEFAHVYKERSINSTANPEVKECAEECANQLEEFYPMFGKEYLLKVLN